MGPPTLGLNTSAAPAGAFGSFSANTSFGAKPSGFGTNTSTFGLNTTGILKIFRFYFSFQHQNNFQAFRKCFNLFV